MMKSKMTSSASRSKKWGPSAMPARPFSMMRKNGSSALKSSRSVIVVVMMCSGLCPRLRGSPGELGERDRRYPSDRLDGVGRPGAQSGGNGLCQHPQRLAVLGGHAGRHATLHPHLAVDVVVLHRSSDGASDDLGGLAHRERLRARER